MRPKSTSIGSFLLAGFPGRLLALLCCGLTLLECVDSPLLLQLAPASCLATTPQDDDEAVPVHSTRIGPVRLAEGRQAGTLPITLALRANPSGRSCPSSVSLALTLVSPPREVDLRN